MKSEAYTKSISMKMRKFSLFQPPLFTSRLHEIFKFMALHYFKHNARCIFFQTKKPQTKITTTTWSILLDFLVSKLERNNDFSKNCNGNIKGDLNALI